MYAGPSTSFMAMEMDQLITATEKNASKYFSRACVGFSCSSSLKIPFFSSYYHRFEEGHKSTVVCIYLSTVVKPVISSGVLRL